MNKCGIYKISCIVNNKFYIGSSKDIDDRWYKHTMCLRGNRHPNQYLQNAWNKYREDNFKFNILEICKIKDLLIREQYYLDELEPYKKEVGYNLSTMAQCTNNAKRYTVISPDGVEYDVVNLQQFSIDNGLDKASLHKVANGTANQHLGWIAKKYEQTWEEWENNKKCQKKSGRGWQGQYKLTYKDGTEEIIDALRTIEKERGWSHGNISALRAGKKKSAYGIVKIQKVE